jgi:hypothetical protein
MGQKESVQNTYIPSLILTFSWDLVATTMLPKNQSLEMALAKTCKALYDCCKRHYKDRTSVVLCNPYREFAYYAYNIKTLQFQNGWVYLKLISILDLQSSNCPVKTLCLDEKLNVPEELNSACVDSLIIRPYYTKSIPTIFVIEKFTNLRSLSLNRVILDNNVISMISKLSFLKVISLRYCEITGAHLSKIFKACTIVEEFELFFKDPAASIRLPPQMKRVHIEGLCHSMKIDLSRCTQLQSL